MIKVFPCPLPIELMSFTASFQNNEVKLNWATATETNNSHFVVQRSIDGQEYENITTLAGQGNSSAPTAYSYTDKNYKCGIAYYRLMQVDFDGKFSHSAVNTVESPCDGILDVELLTLQSDNRVILNIKSTEEDFGGLKIYDMFGRKCLSKTFELQAGNNSFSYDLPHKTSGILYAQIRFIDQPDYKVIPIVMIKK